MFDAGVNPKKSSLKEMVRKCFASYIFSYSKEDGKTRKTRVVLPKIEEGEIQAPMQTGSKDETLLDLWLGNNAKVLSLEDKRPRWSKKKATYVYDFGGRVKQASVKNTQLVMEEKRAEQVKREMEER